MRPIRKMFSFRIDEQLHLQLKLFCIENGHKMSAIMERLIKELLHKKKEKE